MDIEDKIPEPILFNPLKHYLPFIREFQDFYSGDEINRYTKELIRELRHIGTCVMDIYTGNMSADKIFTEVLEFLRFNRLSEKDSYKDWAGTSYNSFRIILLSDSSHWTLKFHNNESRFVHIFPARSSPHSFRVKANTLKSAILYNIFIGKNFISSDDLNTARGYMGLSPIKDPVDTEAITEMIEILRR